jgi:hypothetical protein
MSRNLPWVVPLANWWDKGEENRRAWFPQGARGEFPLWARDLSSGGAGSRRSPASNTGSEDPAFSDDGVRKPLIVGYANRCAKMRALSPLRWPATSGRISQDLSNTWNVAKKTLKCILTKERKRVSNVNVYERRKQKKASGTWNVAKKTLKCDSKEPQGRL